MTARLPIGNSHDCGFFVNVPLGPVSLVGSWSACSTASHTAFGGRDHSERHEKQSASRFPRRHVSYAPVTGGSAVYFLALFTGQQFRHTSCSPVSGQV